MNKLSVFKVLRLALPILRSAIPRIIAATQPTSEGGPRFTSEELEDLAADIGLQFGEALLREFRNRGDIIDG
jgi:hypothetical protein